MSHERYNGYCEDEGHDWRLELTRFGSVVRCINCGRTWATKD